MYDKKVFTFDEFVTDECIKKYSNYFKKSYKKITKEEVKDVLLKLHEKFVKEEVAEYDGSILKYIDFIDTLNNKIKYVVTDDGSWCNHTLRMYKNICDDDEYDYKKCDFWFDFNNDEKWVQSAESVVDDPIFEGNEFAIRRSFLNKHCKIFVLLIDEL